MQTYSDKELLQGIYMHDDNVLNFIYREFLPYVDHFVRQHGGSPDEAKDVFQEGIIIVYYKITEGRLSLNCKFSTYLFAVCKNVWMQNLKKKKRQPAINNEIMDQVREPSVEVDPVVKRELKELFDRQFSSLSFDCQRILRMYYNGFDFEEIRNELGYKTIHHTIDRKYRCNKSLIKRIIEDPNFNELKDEIY